MRLILFVLTSLFIGFSSVNAQVIGGEQDKLFDLYLLEKFDDCYFKALKMTESEKYRADPEPYLYVSMCALKFNDNEEDKEAYGDPLKDALKYAAKAKKYHAKCVKKGITTFAMEDNMEFFETLNQVALEEIVYHYNEDKYSKAASWGKKLAKVDPQNEAVQVLVGANMLLSRNLEGQKLIDEYWPKVEEKYGSGDEFPEESTRTALIYGVLALCKFYNDNGESAKAKTTIQFGKDIFVDNMKIERKYEELNP